MAGREAEDCAGIWGHNGWQFSWHNVLLAMYILSSCLLNIQAQIRPIKVAADPPFPKIGGNVTITPQSAMDFTVACRWYRMSDVEANLILALFIPKANLTIIGQMYTKREKVEFPSCVLQITNLTANDSVKYLVAIEGTPAGREVGSIDLNVTKVSDDPDPVPGKSNSLSKGVIAGLVVGSLILVVAL